MGLTIIKEPGRIEAPITAAEHFIVTLDGSRLVEPGESGQQLAVPGQLIPGAVARRLGIGPDGRRIAPEPLKASAPAENKDMQPQETKAKRRRERKA